MQGRWYGYMKAGLQWSLVLFLDTDGQNIDIQLWDSCRVGLQWSWVLFLDPVHWFWSLIPYIDPGSWFCSLMSRAFVFWGERHVVGMIQLHKYKFAMIRCLFPWSWSLILILDPVLEAGEQSISILGMQWGWYALQANLTCRETGGECLATIQWESFVPFTDSYSPPWWLVTIPDLDQSSPDTKETLAMALETFVNCISFHLSTSHLWVVPVWFCKIFPDTDRESWQRCRGSCCGG